MQFLWCFFLLFSYFVKQKYVFESHFLSIYREAYFSLLLVLAGGAFPIGFLSTFYTGI